MQGVIPDAEPLNVFALVIYVPEPLGSFLDELRRELVPQYDPHAHVSVLPPRSLPVSLQVASEQAGALVASRPPFEIELTDVAVFPVTGVVYLEVGTGGDELRRLHSATRSTALEFPEPFVYHPHVTLAQEIPAGGVEAVRDLAVTRWREYPGKRTFRAEHAVLVQNTSNNSWIDLRECKLGASNAR